MPRTLHVTGTILFTILIAAVAVTFMTSACECAPEDECFCPNTTPEALVNVTEKDLSSLPDEVRLQYQSFLDAWEEEYFDRNREWTAAYEEFHAEKHSAAEIEAFDRSLRQERRDFVLLFRQRNALYLEQNGIQKM